MHREQIYSYNQHAAIRTRYSSLKVGLEPPRKSLIMPLTTSQLSQDMSPTSILNHGNDTISRGGQYFVEENKGLELANSIWNKIHAMEASVRADQSCYTHMSSPQQNHRDTSTTMKHKEWLPDLQLKLSQSIENHGTRSHMKNIPSEINTMLTLTLSPYSSSQTNAT